MAPKWKMQKEYTSGLEGEVARLKAERDAAYAILYMAWPFLPTAATDLRAAEILNSPPMRAALARKKEVADG